MYVYLYIYTYVYIYITYIQIYIYIYIFIYIHTIISARAPMALCPLAGHVAANGYVVADGWGDSRLPPQADELGSLAVSGGRPS